jgi:polyhydroxyalkanoate synthesis repressor PhaR
MRRIIRRYANRKMYDPQARRTVTLDDIGGLLREGLRIQVIDHTTGSDITSLTLSKVLLEQEKETSSSPWGSLFLEELIRQRWGALLEVVERSLSTSLEAIGAAEDKLRKMVRDLEGYRKIDRQEGQRMLEKGLHHLAESKTDIQQQLEKLVRRMITAPGTFSGSEPTINDGILRPKALKPSLHRGARKKRD